MKLSTILGIVNILVASSLATTTTTTTKKVAHNKNDDDVGYFWHITDTHISPSYLQGTDPNTHCYSGTGSAGRYGNFLCDTPVLLLNTAVEAMIKRVGEPDFVLYGGDHVSMPDPALGHDMTVERLQNITEYLLAFQRAHPTTKIFPVVGNHDVYPQFQFQESAPFYVYSEVARLWEPFVGEAAAKTLNHSAYYTAEIVPGLRLVALNTPILYIYNYQVSTSTEDPAGQFEWLRNTLSEAKAKGEKVIVTTHIPPGLDEFDHEKGFHDEFDDRYVGAFDGFNDIIVGSFYGHNHLESFRLIKDRSGENAHVAFLTSSVTPNVDVNPSVTLFKYKKSYPFTILDRIALYVDVVATDKAQGELKWVETPSEAEEYGMEDMSAESVDKFIAQMEVDDALFGKFFDRLHLYFEGKTCDETCKKKILCVVNNVYNVKAFECMNNV